MTAKQTPYYDAEIDAYIERAGVRRALDNVLNRRFEHRVVQLHWTGSVRLRTEGTLDPAFATEAMAAPGHQRGWETTAVQAAHGGAHLAHPVATQGPRIDVDRIIKPIQGGRGQREGFLERRIYRFGPQ